MLERVARSLKPGGVLVLQDYLDWGSMKIIPPSDIHRRVVQACMVSWQEGDGEIARDTSGVAPAMDLSIENEVTWMSNYGLAFSGGRAMADSDTSRKLYDRIADPITGSSQYSVEAWVVPANTDQEGPARIVSYSKGTGKRNFTLGQVLYYYDFRNRMNHKHLLHRSNYQKQFHPFSNNRLNHHR